MGKPALHVLCVLACVAASIAVTRAQEGHPLTGTWTGDWGPNPEDRTRLTLVMEWDGKTVSGTLNPGPTAIPLAGISLDVTSWTVRLEAEAEDLSGKPTRLEGEGRIEDLGSWHRQLVGTWTQGAVTGDFRLMRQ